MKIKENNLEVFENNFTLMVETFYGKDDVLDAKVLSFLYVLDFDALVQVLTSKFETPLVYSVKSNNEFATQYRSEPLFETRAAKICTIFERGCFSDVQDEYETEIWMTEDYEFAVVKLFKVSIPAYDGYTTEFRTVKGFTPDYNLCCCPFEDFDTVIENLIAQFYENEVPICEI